MAPRLPLRSERLRRPFGRERSGIVVPAFGEVSLTVVFGRCIIYIMRRTQLYLDDQLWNALHARARTHQTTVSELVRQAARERYLGRREEQKKAMQEFVGVRKRSSDLVDTIEYVRELRRSGRLDNLLK